MKELFERLNAMFSQSQPDKVQAAILLLQITSKLSQENVAIADEDWLVLCNDARIVMASAGVGMLGASL